MNESILVQYSPLLSLHCTHGKKNKRKEREQMMRWFRIYDIHTSAVKVVVWNLEIPWFVVVSFELLFSISSHY
jgi:hypothetical protein